MFETPYILHWHLQMSKIVGYVFVSTCLCAYIVYQSFKVILYMYTNTKVMLFMCTRDGMLKLFTQSRKGISYMCTSENMPTVFTNAVHGYYISLQLRVDICCLPIL